MSTKKEKEVKKPKSVREAIYMTSKEMADNIKVTMSNLCPDLPDMLISQFTDMFRMSSEKGATLSHVMFGSIIRDYIRDCFHFRSDEQKDQVLSDVDRLLEWDKIEEALNDASNQ